MHSRNWLLPIIALVTLVSSANRLVEVKQVILYVDTERVDKSNLSETCNFGQPAGISNEDYTLDVSVGDIIVWKGISSSNPDRDKVWVTSIDYVRGARFFNRKRLKEARENRGLVRGTVVKGNPGDIEKYNLFFIVFNREERKKGVFRIDPKLRIK